MLKQEGWQVNHKRVERIWRQEGLKVPQQQPKRRRLWLNDGSCIRLRPQPKNHVWNYDFVMARTADERGSIKEKIMLINGCFRIIIESEKSKVVIRGLSPERHYFLNDESTSVIFCNLGRDTSEGFYIENILTTGYAIK